MDQKPTTGPSKGYLIAHGGGRISRDGMFRDVFTGIAGGCDCGLIYIPTALSDEQLEGRQKRHLDPDYARALFGFGNVTVLHTRDRKQADSEEFIMPLTEAGAVFISGGRQWRLADSYLGTRTHEELIRLLGRGGVIAGISAGATIQGSLLIRANSRPDDNKIMIGDHQEGFGFIKNVAIDQHLLKLERQFDMPRVFDRYPDLLGIGIDEDTFISVTGNEMSVFGSGYVTALDGPLIKGQSGRFTDLHAQLDGYRLLRHGDRYDLKKREKIN